VNEGTSSESIDDEAKNANNNGKQNTKQYITGTAARGLLEKQQAPCVLLHTFTKPHVCCCTLTASPMCNIHILSSSHKCVLIYWRNSKPHVCYCTLSPSPTCAAAHLQRAPCVIHTFYLPVTNVLTCTELLAIRAQITTNP
jgi:hypothetical protein